LAFVDEFYFTQITCYHEETIMPAVLPCNSRVFMFFLLFSFISLHAFSQTITGKVSDAAGKVLRDVPILLV